MTKLAFFIRCVIDNQYQLITACDSHFSRLDAIEMGNQSSSQKKKQVQVEPTVESVSPTKSMGMIRSPSGADFNDKSHTKFAPVDELAKILAKKNEHEGSGSGITDHVFAKYVFHSQPDLGMRLFRHFHTSAHAKTQHLGVTAFRQQCERFLSILNDQKIIELYVRIFCCSDNEENATKDGVKSLIKLSFNIAMAHYSGDVQVCPSLESTLDAVIATCFFQEPLSVGFIARWLEENCPRLILPIHRFCLHLLTTSYRNIKMNDEDRTGNGLELATPVLEKGAPFGNSQPLLTLSMAWILAGTLAPLYSKPQSVPAPKEDESSTSTAVSPTSALPSQQLLSKLVAAVPSHWTMLYDTRQHGVGANRFLHHVLGYRGPSLIVIHARSLKDETEKIYCVASSTEWRETNLYIGGDESCLIQLQPKFSVMERGKNILFLNTHIRGYPKGLRVAVDPRNPIIAVNEDFEKLDVHSIAHDLLNIEVWGCGDKSSRDVQLDIKKWQIKEAERQRTVKLTAADWIDNPDRYLLELGGRPQYNNSNK